MITKTKTLVVLQYGRAGEAGPAGPITKEDAEQFVDLDDRSGGYPCSVPFEKAVNFETVAAAAQYSQHFKGLHVRTVYVTYRFTQDERLVQCPVCHGQGTVSEIVDHDADFNTVWASRQCYRCDGSGKTEQ